MNYEMFLDFCKSRHSCRSYLNIPVEDDKMLKIMQAGQWVASAHGKLDVYICRVKDIDLHDKIKRRIQYLMRVDDSFDPLYGAPELIVVCANASFGNYDGSLAMGNMMLAAHSLDLGSCWINTAQYDHCYVDPVLDVIHRKIGLSDDMLVDVGYLIVGYPKDNSNYNVIPRKLERLIEI